MKNFVIDRDPLSLSWQKKYYLSIHLPRTDATVHWFHVVDQENQDF